MDTQSTQDKYGKANIIKAFACLEAHFLINCYAAENFIFGRIKAGDEIPACSYLSDLGLQKFEKFLSADFMNGRAIENGRLKKLDYEKTCFEIFRDKIEYVFDGAPVDKNYEENETDIFHYKNGLYDYLKDLYVTFREIVATDAPCDLFAAVPDVLDKDEQREYYLKVTKFVAAVRMRKLRQGGCINRYVKDLPFMSPFIMRLITKKKGRYLLKNNDPDSTDYKLALLSCFRFYNGNNAKLFELKALKWAEHKA